MCCAEPIYWCVRKWGVEGWGGQETLRTILEFIILPTTDMMGINFQLLIFSSHLTNKLWGKYTN